MLNGWSQRICVASLSVATLALFAGCGGETGPRLYPVTGTVTLDGEPIPTATILLQDPSRQDKTYIALVKDGVVSGEATAGQKSLLVTAIRQAVGKTIPGADGTGEEPATEQYLPERYNLKTTLTTEITSPGPNVLDLKLESR